MPPIAGLSDHDIVLAYTNIVPSTKKRVKRLIHLWKKVDTSKMAADLERGFRQNQNT
jgi:hypothetical protein